MGLFAGAGELAVAICRGIKQGCPLSGTLWALLVDLAVRFLCCSIQYKSSCLAAYADDLGFVLNDLWKGTQKLMEAFILIEKATTLSLNFGKAIIAPLCGYTLANVKERLKACAPTFAAAKIADHAEHLGVLLGPGAWEMAWKGPVAILRARAARIKSL